MTFLSCQNITKSYGGRFLFKDLSFGVASGDKIGLIGPNGSGKSTLLKILAGIESPDEGSVVKNRSLRIGYIPQLTTFSNESIQSLMLEALQHQNHLSLNDKQTKINITLSKLGFNDASVSASSLSGGWKKRLALALELIRSPDLLLLDEPTNHLDLEGVLWLEKFLKNTPLTYLIISHDRTFLEHTTTRMMELDKAFPKGLFTTEGQYSVFLEKRDEFLNGQKQQERSLNSKVRREVEWLKQNPKARTTKSQSRIQEAKNLIQELRTLKNRNKTARNQFDFSSSLKETQKLITLHNLTKSLGNRPLFSGIDLVLSPGMRLGIVGLNGSGKTTFLRLIANELTPDQGTIKVADGVKIVYFDQHREQIPPHISLGQALSPEGDTVCYRGKTIHVNSWCKRFLFNPDRLDLPFGHLSGGEKARVYIARLMLEPADVLLLDEPTNDLDIPTLEVLENSLLDFPGAVVLISHDRYMLDQIANMIIGLGTGCETELFADFRQWEQHQSEFSQKVKGQTKDKSERKDLNKSNEERPRKLSYSEKKEWEQMASKIETLENEISQLHACVQNLADVTEQNKLQQACQELGVKEQMLDKLYHRWQELESKIEINK